MSIRAFVKMETADRQSEYSIEQNTHRQLDRQQGGRQTQYVYPHSRLICKPCLQ